MPCSAYIRSHIGTLPTETLVAIFLLIAPVYVRLEDWSKFSFRRSKDNQVFPITLSAVSKAWRDIVVSTPALWTSLLWKEGLNNPMLLALHVERSGSLPLHLILCFRHRSCYTDNRSLVSPSVDRIVLHNLSRITTLHLFQPPDTWLDQFGSLTSTTTMSISWHSWTSKTNGEVLLNKCRSLRRLRLFQSSSFSLNDHDEQISYKLPYSLEELYLTAIPLGTSIKLFLLSPNLVKFSATSITPPNQILSDEVSQWWFCQPCVFEHLEEFEWDRRDDGWANHLLSQVSTPRLRRLCLTGLDTRYSPISPTEEENQFFRRLPDTLSTLELNCMVVFPFTISLLSHCSSLENLILRWIMPKYIGHVFKGLTPTHGHQRSLPKLRNLSIWGLGIGRTAIGNSELTPEHLQFMVSMLERRSVKGDVFCLTFSDCTLVWTPAIRGKLRSLKAKGVQLEIVEGSDAVDWLE